MYGFEGVGLLGVQLSISELSVVGGWWTRQTHFMVGPGRGPTKKVQASLQSLFWRSTNSRMVDPAWKAHPPSNYPMLGPTPGPGGLQTSFCRTLWDLLQLGEGAISHQKSGPRTRPWCSALPTFARGPAHNVLHRFRRLCSGGAS